MRTLLALLSLFAFAGIAEARELGTYAGVAPGRFVVLGRRVGNTPFRTVIEEEKNTLILHSRGGSYYGRIVNDVTHDEGRTIEVKFGARYAGIFTFKLDGTVTARANAELVRGKLGFRERLALDPSDRMVTTELMPVFPSLVKK
jgi:hypothetical protein